MTVVHDPLFRVHDGETLAPVLRATHEVWLRETDRFLLPIILREASFWSRWTAARYLADQFLGQFRRERALVNELRAFLPHPVAERLERDAEVIHRLQSELDQVGRRRGSAHKMSPMARSFLQLLRSWCADTEAAAGEIPRDSLTPEGRRLLFDLERYASIHS